MLIKLLCLCCDKLFPSLAPVSVNSLLNSHRLVGYNSKRLNSLVRDLTFSMYKFSDLSQKPDGFNDTIFTSVSR